MSIDAITYAKTLDVDNPMSRLLLFIIAENTFNDTGLCKVGQQVLARETRASERTVREHIAKLKGAKVIGTKAQPKEHGGRSFDAIELIGFIEWLESVRSKPAKSAGSGGGGEPKSKQAKNAGSPVRTGRQVAGSIKEARTVHPVQITQTKFAAPAEPGIAVVHGDFGDGQKADPSGDLIPFDDPPEPEGVGLSEFIDGMNAADRAVARLAGKKVDDPREARAPFTSKVLAKISMMCVDLEALVARYHESATKAKRAGRPYKDPSAVLYRMAQGVVAQREGVPVSLISELNSSDRATRAQASAEAVGVEPELPEWRRRAPVNPDRSRLAAALRSSR